MHSTRTVLLYISQITIDLFYYPKSTIIVLSIKATSLEHNTRRTLIPSSRSDLISIHMQQTSPLNLLYSKNGLAESLSYSSRRRDSVDGWVSLGLPGISWRGKRVGSTGETEEIHQFTHGTLVHVCLDL